MTIKVNGNEVINFSSLLVPETESALLEFEHDGDQQRFSLNFEIEEPENEKEGKTRSLRFAGEENYLSLTFVNWDSPIGVSTGKPIEVGETEKGELIYILANVAKLGGLYRVDIQTMLGGTNVPE